MLMAITRSLDLDGLPSAVVVAWAGVSMLSVQPGELVEVRSTDPEAVVPGDRQRAGRAGQAGRRIPVRDPAALGPAGPVAPLGFRSGLRLGFRGLSYELVVVAV